MKNLSLCFLAGRWVGKFFRAFFPQIQSDKNALLLERNRIIDNHVRRYEDSGTYSVDNAVIACIKEICEHEGMGRITPKYREWLSDWEKRGDIPIDYLELKNQIKNRFALRQKELAEEESARMLESVENLISSNQKTIDIFLGLATRKVSIVDDYGDENWAALEREIDVCCGKLMKNIGYINYCKSEYQLTSEIKNRLKESFNYHYKEYKAKFNNIIDFEVLSGVDFEETVKVILTKHGFQVRKTPATNDQGADLICTKDGRKIIIQAKRYSKNVGNKAVQEVISALKYYNGDEGWVVTNAGFTKQAKDLAHLSNIRLVDGTELQRLINA